MTSDGVTQLNSNPAAASSPAPAVSVRHVFLAFEDKVVLDDVSFELRAGETLILLGVTGSGKSVLLKLLLGLIKPDSGQVLIEGKDLGPLEETELFPFRR